MKKNDTTAKTSTMSIKTKAALLIGSPLLVILICSIIICISVKNLEEEPTSPAITTIAQELLREPANGENAADSVRDLLGSAINADDVKTDFVPSAEVKLIASNLSEERENLLNYAISKTGTQLAETFYDAEKYSSTYGVATAAEKGLMPSGTADVEFEKNDDGNFVFTYTPAEANDGLFSSEDKEMMSGISAAVNDFFEGTQCDTQIDAGEVKATLVADPLTALSISIEKTRYYTLTVTTQQENGEEISVSLNIEIGGRLDFTFAGISIEQDVIKIHGNGYDNLSIIANVDENASSEDFTVTFTSSDPTVCTVDENGTVEAVKTSDTPVTVTVTLVYLGKTYSDSCLVYVTDDSNINISAAGRISPDFNG